MLVDGYGDGAMLEAPAFDLEFLRKTSFAILQGSRMRNTKTEFVSCPSCGRTLFDLQARTHLLSLLMWQKHADTKKAIRFRMGLSPPLPSLSLTPPPPSTGDHGADPAEDGPPAGCRHRRDGLHRQRAGGDGGR